MPELHDKYQKPHKCAWWSCKQIVESDGLLCEDCTDAARPPEARFDPYE